MKMSNQNIVDQDEVTVGSVNKLLLSVDYPSASTQHPKELVLIHPLENIEISDYLREGDVGFKKPKVSSTCLCIPTYSLHITCAEKEAPNQQACHRILCG